MDSDLSATSVQSSITSLQQGDSSPLAVKSELMQGFKDILLSTFMTATGSDDVTDDSNSLLSSTIQTLAEQLLSQQLSDDMESGTNIVFSALLSSGNSLAAANSVHINQFDAELEVGGDNSNSNCGPTSLVMALHQLGLRIEGETASTSDGKAVDLARLSMADSTATDGVDSNGNRVDAEHNYFTDFDDIARGAAAAGANTKIIDTDASSIIKALNKGSAVIVSGTFAGKSPLPWTGDRGSDNNSAPGNATSHIIEISSYDSGTGLFTINDPARNSANQITATELEYFMSGNAGAIVIGR